MELLLMSKEYMPKSNNRRKKPRQERRKKTTKNTQLGYRGISRMQEQPYPTFSENACRFPDLFHGAGCCICGHEDAQECPCGPLEALGPPGTSPSHTGLRANERNVGMPNNGERPRPEGNRARETRHVRGSVQKHGRVHDDG